MEYDKSEFEREWIEFLNEVRTALPGVQLLFGFLLTVPFTPGFAAAQELVRSAYLACFLTTTGACAFLMAPSAYHRLHWRRDVRDKDDMLKTCNALVITGTVLLALAMSAAVFCVLWMVYPRWPAVAATAVSAGLFSWLWFGLPLSRRRKEQR